MKTLSTIALRPIYSILLIASIAVYTTDSFVVINLIHPFFSLMQSARTGCWRHVSLIPGKFSITSSYPYKSHLFNRWKLLIAFFFPMNSLICSYSAHVSINCVVILAALRIQWSKIKLSWPSIALGLLIWATLAPLKMRLRIKIFLKVSPVPFPQL